MNKDKSLNNRDGEEGDVDMVQKMKENGIYTHVRFYNYVILILTTATIKNNV